MSENQFNADLLNNLLSQVNPSMISNVLNNIDPNQISSMMNLLKNQMKNGPQNNSNTNFAKDKTQIIEEEILENSSPKNNIYQDDFQINNGTDIYSILSSIQGQIPIKNYSKPKGNKSSKKQPPSQDTNGINSLLSNLMQNMNSQNQGFNPSQNFNSSQGFNSNENFNQAQGFAPNQNFNQAQGFVPNQNFNQAQGFVPNQNFNQGQGSIPNQNFNQAQANPYQPRPRYGPRRNPLNGMSNLMSMLGGNGMGGPLNMMNMLGGNQGMGNIMKMFGGNQGMGNIMNMLGGNQGMGNIMNMLGGNQGMGNIMNMLGGGGGGANPMMKMFMNMMGKR